MSDTWASPARPHCHHRRLPRIDPLKNSGNRLLFASSGSRSRFREGQGKQVPCVGLFTPLGVLRSYVIAPIVLAFHVVATSARIRAPPRSPGDRSCRGVLEPPSPRSLYTHACRVSCAAGQSALLFVIMLTLTPASRSSAVSTGTIRDPRDQPSSSPRATSSRSLFITRSSCSSSSHGVLLLLSARGLTRDQSSLRVPSHPLRSLSASNLSDPRKQPP